MSGPYETERQAATDPAVRAVYEAFAADPGVGKMVPHNERMLTDACAAAGVKPGGYDQRIITWLAGWEPQVCAVIAGLITRAASAPSPAGTAAQLASLAGWIDEQLDDETASRQHIAETAAARVRDIRLHVLAAADLAERRRDAGDELGGAG